MERDVFNPLFVCVMFDFNSHAHVERDFFVCTRSHSIFRFQLTRSRGAWHYRMCVKILQWYFNSHAHVERDVTNITRFLLSVFQLTRSRGAWHAGEEVKVRFVNFNSHAHVERDNQNFMTVRWHMISTHTLTWSVTISASLMMSGCYISTHTLTWSVTPKTP